MSYFSSEYECKLDAKGRLVLPSRIKSNLPEAAGNNIVLSRGFEQCLVVYPVTEWKKIFSKVAGLSEFNEEYRNFQRSFFKNITEVELDSHGRFVVPKLYLKYAEIDKDAIVVGAGNRIEIWNPDKYEQNLIRDQKELSKMAEKILSSNE
ncbi:MAG: division/cell wall cluster transcriptional repressor MraZ [Cytophagaceae bacterium]